MTALANPKVALFYVALLPQFVPPGAAVLPMTLLLAGVQIGLSCAWYAVLAAVVERARRAVARRRELDRGAVGDRDDRVRGEAARSAR